MRWFYLVLVFIGLLFMIGCSSKDEVVGLWVYSMDKGIAGTGEIRMDLNDDGTANLSINIPGTIDAIDANWKIEDGDLCLNAACNKYAVEGDKLTYTIGGETFLFERWPNN